MKSHYAKWLKPKQVKNNCDNINDPVARPWTDLLLQGQINMNSFIHKYQQYEQQLKCSDKADNFELQYCNLDLVESSFQDNTISTTERLIEQTLLIRQRFPGSTLNPFLINKRCTRPIALEMGWAPRRRSSQLQESWPSNHFVPIFFIHECVFFGYMHKFVYLRSFKLQPDEMFQGVSKFSSIKCDWVSMLKKNRKKKTALGRTAQVQRLIEKQTTRYDHGSKLCAECLNNIQLHPKSRSEQ